MIVQREMPACTATALMVTSRTHALANQGSTASYVTAATSERIRRMLAAPERLASRFLFVMLDSMRNMLQLRPLIVFV
jgi:hypothetical protein